MRTSTLTLTSTAFIFGSTVLAIAISACGSSDPPPAAQPTAYPPTATYNPGYPQQPGYPAQPQAYPQQPGYPAQPTAYPTQPVAPATAGGQMATPGPLALPCQNDGSCGLHRCNVAAGKCAFPCQTAVDCAQGNNCLMGVCAPSMGGQ